MSKTISHILVAEKLGIQPKNLAELIEKHISEFKKLGGGFTIVHEKQESGQNKVIINLNSDHIQLINTLTRTNDKNIKAKLVDLAKLLT